MFKVDLLIIDPQIDFCDPNGSLYVNGADKDMERLANFIVRTGNKLNDIHVTLDTHHLLDIGHPLFWIDASGKHPAPFTIITYDDVKVGKWRTTVPGAMDRATAYVKALADNKRYLLCVWPPHCLIGSKGTQVYPEVWKALSDWEGAHVAFVDYVTKGSNMWTEHYSAVLADVPDPIDPSTQLNTRLIQRLQEVDEIIITGEALSHCVANTIRDIADNFGEENIKKFVLLDDCSSSVGGFENLGTDFVKEMTGRGMRVAKSTDVLS